VSPAGHGGATGRTGSGPTTPSAAVCLTVRNSRREVELLLDDLARQVTEVPFEVSIVDAFSTDGTFEYLSGLAAHFKTPTGGRLSVTRARGNIATGRNLAIRRATAECILTTDAGSRLEPGWLDGMVRVLREGGAAWVASSFCPPRATTGWHGAISATITPAPEEFLAGTVLPSARGTCFWRKDFERAGGYPEHLDHTEDLVFYRRLTEEAGTCAWFLEAPVEWDGRRRLAEFFRAYSNYARGDALAHIYLRRNLARFAYYGAMTAAVLVQGRR
jgi:glycosyltransferase involved in cell wall biosynthesis